MMGESELSPREEREKKTAADILERSEREIRRLTEFGVDISALSDRFEAAKGHFASGRWTETEGVCSEILILAKSMQAITSASMKASAGASAGAKMSEAQKLEIGRMISKEVSERIEAVARTLPTSATLEVSVQQKIQEALVTGGLIDRIENLATQRAQAAVASIPRFTAKDAQAAANLVVQRALTQFLSSKELVTKVKASVETEMARAVEDASKQVEASMGAVFETRIADATSPLPTRSDVEGLIEGQFQRLLRMEPFEERVLELASERAKAEVERAPDVMSEVAGRIAREASSNLLNTYVRSPEFAEQVRGIANDQAAAMLGSMQSISVEDVEIISRRVAEESMQTLADSDVLREKMETLGAEIVGRELSAEGFDEKVRTLARETTKPEELSARVDAAEQKLAERVEGLERQVSETTAESIKGLQERLEELERKLTSDTQESLNSVRERLAEIEQKTAGGAEEAGKLLQERLEALEQKFAAGAQDSAAQIQVRIEALEQKFAAEAAESAAQLQTRLEALEQKIGEGLSEKIASALGRLDELSTGVASKSDVDEKIAEMRKDLLTNADFAEWIKDGALAAMKESGLGEGIADLEKTFVNSERAEKIARHEALTAAMDILETKEFTRRIIELIGEDEVKSQIGGGGVDAEQLGLQIQNAFVEQMESEEFAEKVKGLASEAGGGGLQELLINRIERIEKEALPALVENIVTKRLGDSGDTSIDDKIQGALAAKLDGDALNKQILSIAQSSIGQIANTPEFKEMLDGKFKILMNYLSQEVIPKQIKRITGAG